MEEPLAGSAIGVEGEKRSQRFQRKHVLGCTDAQTNGGTVRRLVNWFVFSHVHIWLLVW